MENCTLPVDSGCNVATLFIPSPKLNERFELISSRFRNLLASSPANLSAGEMEIWIFVKTLATCSLMAAASSAKCPFPAIPANGYLKERSMKPSCSRDPLEPGEIARFGCSGAWRLSQAEGDSVECTADGSLKGVPRCLRRVASFRTAFYYRRQLQKAEPSSENLECFFDFERIVVEPTAALNVSEIAEVRLGTCIPWSSTEIRVSLNNWIDCSVAVQSPLETSFVCSDLNQSSPVPLEFISLVKTTFVSMYITDVIVFTRPNNYCGEPPLPINGGFRPTPTGQFHFYCDSNFSLSGSSQAECDPSTGKWSPLPTCQPNFCHPPAIKDGQFEPISNGSYRYRCDEHFTLHGNETATCDPATGRWSRIPICKLDRCWNPPTLVSGRIGIISPGKFRFECAENSVLRGHGTVECDPSTGQWSVPACEKDCPVSWPVYVAAPVIGTLVIQLMIYILWKRITKEDQRRRRFSVKHPERTLEGSGSHFTSAPPSPVSLVDFAIPE